MDRIRDVGIDCGDALNAANARYFCICSNNGGERVVCEGDSFYGIVVGVAKYPFRIGMANHVVDVVAWACQRFFAAEAFGASIKW